jgi:hypothetical protein
MADQKNFLPAELETELSIGIPFLLERGWEIFEFRYEPQTFGNWYIDFFRSDLTIRLVKERSQYSVEGNAGELRSTGMWRVFMDATEFQQAIIDWIEHPGTTISR